jgi:hypothetical protein
MRDNPFGKGSSGGAWLDGNVAIGLNSFNYDNDKSSMWGPQFDANTVALYEFVRNGCSSSNVPSEVKLPTTSVTITPDAQLFPKNLQFGLADDAQCSCPGSKRTILQNTTANRYLARIRTVRHGPLQALAAANDVEAEILPGERRPLACSIERAPDGRCLIRNTTSLISSSRIQRFSDKSGITKLQSVSPSYCSAMCAEDAPTGYCLQLGTSAGPILSSLGSFVSTTLDNPSSGEVIATIADMVRTFNGDPVLVGNPCERGSFFRTNDMVSNDGLNCVITTAPLGSTSNALRISLSTPTQTMAMKSKGAGETLAVAVFVDKNLAPVLQYSGPANVAELNSLFGGSVVAVQRSKTNLIVTTENGCVVGDKQ